MTGGGLRTKRGGLNKASHGATTPPQQITGRPNYRPAHANTRSPYDNTIVAEGDCVCVYFFELSVTWDGVEWSSGFPPKSETNGAREIHFPLRTDG